MLKTREYFNLDGEQATRIDEYAYAITESGRIWKFWNKEPGKEQEDKVTSKLFKNGKNYVLRPGFYSPRVPDYGYVNIELRGDSKLRSDLKPWHTGAQKFIRNIKRVLLHVLVAQHFIPNPDEHKFVEHIDGIKTNNHYSNLRWIAEDPINFGYYTERNEGASLD
ncbi:HNH endonuclease [Hymenobacter baengnokdamensis]|uniref:HNH endonuclease n=1 Tax=Hymenobacter baengnokdamensis TaxID=2615203 RepID=UPI0012481489|nr:HNH endonuclease [Hymenobacter baengnokdamensis]